MKIGIDVRLKNETGVGRYICHLMELLPKLAPQHEFVFINPDIRWHSAGEQLKMPGIIREHNLDLVHIPYFNVPILLGTPFVVTMHDLIVNQFNTGRASTLPYPVYKGKRAAYRIATTIAMWRARSIIVPSRATKKELLKHYNISEKKVFVTYEGVDTIENHSEQKPEFSVTPHKYFLYVGNAYPHKNIERLLSAFTRVYDMHLVLVGQTNYFYERLRQKVKQDKIERVIFADYMNDGELLWLYKNAHAVVLPSVTEGFGLPALEAMKIGVPLLASDIPVLHELCEDVPLYFDPYSIEDMAQMLKASYTHRFQLEKGKKRASEFKWEKMVKETIAIYESSISIRPGK